MSGSTEGFADYIIDCLSSLGTITQGRFFGGVGLKEGSVQFAMIMGNALFFVVDDSNRVKYEKMDMECFWYNTKKGKVNVRKYFEVPAEIIEEQDVLTEWAKESIHIAYRLKKK